MTAPTLAIPPSLKQECCGNVRSDPASRRTAERPAMDTTTRLADAMEQRRVELGYEWEDICRLADVSSTFLRKFRRGASGARPLTKVRIEDALAWKRGSIDAVLAGGQPDPVDPPIPTIGELLVQYGVLPEDELTDLEDHRDAKVIELLGRDDMTDKAARDFLELYMLMRRRVFTRE